MSVQDPLLQLISSLSPIQAAQAKRNLRGRKLELFKAMVSTKKYLREDLGKEFREMSDANFAVVRATLLAELTLQFGHAEVGESVREQVRELEMKATVLHKGGKIKRALTTLDKALSIARAAENWEEAARVLGLIQLIVDDPESPEELARSIAVAQPSSQIQQIRTAMIACRQAKGSDPAVMEKCLKALDQVLKPIGQPTTAKLGLHYHHARAFAALFRGDLGLAKHHLDLAHGCILRLPGMLHDPLVMQAAMAVALSRSSLAMQLQSAIGALEGLQSFLAMLPAGNARSGSALHTRVQWLEIVHAFESQNWTLWDEIHDSLDAEPGTGGFMAGSRAAIYAGVASMAMARGMPSLALRWFERAFDLRKHIETTDTFQVMGVVYLTACAEQGDWESMETNVPRARNLLLRRGMPEGIVRELGLACLAIDRGRSRMREEWVALLKRLDTPSVSQSNQYIFSYLNLRDWVVRQINGLEGA